MRQRHRRNFFRAHQLREFPHRRERNLLQVFRYAARCNRRSRGHPHRQFRSRQLDIRAHQRIKNHRGLHAIRQMQIVNVLISLGRLLQISQHHFTVCIGNRHVRDHRSLADHVHSDFLWLALGHGPEHAGEKRAGEPQLRACSKKIAAVHCWNVFGDWHFGWPRRDPRKKYSRQWTELAC